MTKCQWYIHLSAYSTRWRRRCFCRCGLHSSNSVSSYISVIFLEHDYDYGFCAPKLFGCFSEWILCFICWGGEIEFFLHWGSSYCGNFINKWKLIMYLEFDIRHFNEKQPKNIIVWYIDRAHDRQELSETLCINIVYSAEMCLSRPCGVSYLRVDRTQTRE